MKRRLLVVTVIVALLIVPAAAAGPLDSPNDAGNGRDAGGSRESAMLVDAPGEYAGNLPLLDLQDWYAFDMLAAAVVCVNWVQSDGLAVGASVYGPSNEYLSGTRCAANDSSSSRFLAGPGRYYVGFSNYYGWAGYHFRIDTTAVPNNTTLPEPPAPPVPPPPAPLLFRLDPARGAPGTAFALEGDHFQSGAKAVFGGANVALETRMNPHDDVAFGVVPHLAPGTYDVTLVNPDGQAATLAKAFEVTLTADPGFLAGDLVISRRPVQVEGQPAQSTPLDMRRVTVTVRNLGFGPTTESLFLTVIAEPDGRIVPAGTSVRTLGTRFLPDGIGAGESLAVTFAWDVKGYLGDYVVRARITPGTPQVSALNDEIAVEHTVAVSGLGGL